MPVIQRRLDFAAPRASVANRGLWAMLLTTLIIAVALIGRPPGPAAAQEEECANQAIREAQGADFLPDCRAWEKVSPHDKNDFDIFGGVVKSAIDGGGVAYRSEGAFADSQSSPAFNQYVSFRQSDGWSVKAILPRGGPTPLIFTRTAVSLRPDLTAAVISAITPPALAPGAFPSGANWYLSDFSTGELQTLNDRRQAPEPVPDSTTVRFGGASAGLDHIVFTSTVPLLPEAAGTTRSLYEWVDGTLRVASVLPNGTLASAADPALSVNDRHDEFNMVSADGRRIFFRASGGPRPGAIYLRENGEQTVEITASQRSEPDPTGPKTPQFAFASDDGSKAFFTTNEQLVDDDTDTATDLYVYDAESGELHRASGDTDMPGATSAQVTHVSGGALDGSRAYFVASGVLAPGAVSGQPNVYLWEADEGDGGEVRFIATVASSERNSFALGMGGAWISDNGRFFAIRSAQNLTGFATGGHAQAYLYDAETGELECGSCNPDGSTPRGPVQFAPTLGWLPDHVLDDGTLFFTSPDPLVPRDTNNRLDVYVYAGEAPQLISSGRGSHDSFFETASPDGTDVYFRTRNQLLAEDVDPNVDLYDARAGGGFDPGPEPPAPCAGSACQGDPTPPPEAIEPGSEGYEGPGNLDSSQQARCVDLERKAQSHQRQARRQQRKAKQLKDEARRASGKRRAALRSKADAAARRAKRNRQKARKLERQARSCREGG